MNTKNFFQKTGLALAGVGIIASAAFSGLGAFAQSATISQELDFGETNSDVTILQTFLAGYPSYYPSGLVTGYYGPLTRAAVIRFQAAYGFAQVGRVGPQTRAQINALILGGTPSTSGDVSAPYSGTVNVQTSRTSVTLAWSTNENARTKVFYSTSPLATAEATTNFTEPYISGSVVSESNYSTAHSMNISGLSPNTTYYYMTESIDSSGNVTVWPFPAGMFTTSS